MNFKSIIFSLSLFTMGTNCSEQKFSFEKIAGHLFTGMASGAAIQTFVPKEYSPLAVGAISALGTFVLQPKEVRDDLVADRDLQLYYLKRNKCGDCGEDHLKESEKLNARIKQHDQQWANTIAYTIGNVIGSTLAIRLRSQANKTNK